MINKIDERLLILQNDMRLQCHFGNTYIYDDKKVYRCIFEQYIDEIKELLESGLIDELVENRLFPKSIICKNVIIGEYKMIIEHERIPLRNNITQWTFNMIKKAIFTVLKVNSIANKYEYELRDGHLDNVMFYYSNCMYIDLDSFVKVKSSKWIAYKEFIENIKLLQLLSLQDNYNYQNSIKAMRYYIPNKIYYSLIPKKEQYTIDNIYSIEELYQRVNNINITRLGTTWDDYHSDYNDKVLTDREHTLVKKLLEINPKVIVDLASNTGMVTKKIFDNIDSLESAVCIDMDHTSVDIMHEKYCNYNITSIFGSVLDTYSSDSLDHPKGDVVLALALTHHLILSSKLDIDYIFRTFKRYCKKYIFVEFMPIGLYAGDLQNTPKVPEWYSEEWFEINFLKYFNLEYKKQYEINRTIFIGTIK